jgi:hypothetical protein
MTRAALREFMNQPSNDHREITATGDALAGAAYDRGDRLTADERAALTHHSRWGSDGYPIVKLGPKWTIDHRCAPKAPLYRTKRDAIRAWEILIAKWIRLAGLEAYDQALAELPNTAAERATLAYQLPDWQIVHIYADTARGAHTITFQLAGGAIVLATRHRAADRDVPEPARACEYCGEPAGEGGALCPACVINHDVRI